MLIQTATAEVHEARHRHRREILERGRLRRLIERVDVVIEACEEAHLQGNKEVPADIALMAERLYTIARRSVKLTGNADAFVMLEEIQSRRQVKIAEVMDCLWAIQEVVFDLMLPWRSELPEDVDPTTDWPVHSAA